MKLGEAIATARGNSRWVVFSISLLLAGGCVSLAADRPLMFVAAIACLSYILFAWASILRPFLFVATYLIAVIALPPFYFSALGETPVYVPALLLPVGIALFIVRMPDFKLVSDTVVRCLLLFLAGTALSLPFAWWLSGSDVGMQSLIRWLFLAQTALIYFLVRGAANTSQAGGEDWIIPAVVTAAVIGAGYGILDFFWPVPLPHPAAPQYIWLASSILRRAQGVVYESSSFANLCSFFLLLTSAAFVSRKERALRIPRPWVLLAMIVLALAVFLSFSRSAWGALLTAFFVFVAVTEKTKVRRALVFIGILAVPLTAIWLYAPELWSYFLSARLGNLSQILADPNLASSGRIDAWERVLSILARHPEYWLFGIGFKSLPLTHRFHQEIVGDNGFLSLFLETGIIGLGSYVFLTAAILRTFLEIGRRKSGSVSFCAAVIFSFWCGELVQMTAADAYTYWRSMVVVFAFVALTLDLYYQEEVAILSGVQT